MKRVTREGFRLQQHELAGIDIVVRVRKSFTQINYPEISRELQAQLNLVGKEFVKAYPQEVP